MVTKLGKSESYCLFGASGAMEQNERVHIHKGTLIHAYGYGMSYQKFVVYDDNMNAVELCEGDPNAVNKYDLGAYYSAKHHLDEETRPHSRKFGIGMYYDEGDELISNDVIEKSLQRADNLAKIEQEEKEKAEQESKEETARLLKEYSYLQKVTNAYDHKICGANIRTELKRKFPNAKFSVRYESFSGGDAYNISWTDGPTTKDVDAVVGKYKHMHPDEYSMGDYWDSVPSNFNDLYGSVGYITTRRDISEEVIKTIMQELEDAGINECNFKEYSAYCNTSYVDIYDAIRVNYRPDCLRDVASYIARCKDLTPVTPKKVNVRIGEVNIIEGYSDKAFAVVGDTRPIKDELKRLGGRFNGRLTCGAGWVFPNTKLQEVKEVIA